MPWFAATVFLSAYLLFFVQPMIARFILPWFGGAPAVWSTCMLFFQIVLLGGYAYSDALVRISSRRWQVAIHALVVLLSLLSLPVVPAEVWRPEGEENPIWLILGLLATTIGGPYFLLSTTGPLMQAWFTASFPTRSPYRLYALSNLGSLLALLGYPFLIEPVLGTRPQATSWGWAYLAFASLAILTGWISLRRTAAQPVSLRSSQAEPANRTGNWLTWLVLSTIPSVLLLAITNELCQDIAVIPFLWILPLSLYLITFIICFDHPRWYVRDWSLAFLALSGVGIVYALCHSDSVSFYFQLSIYPSFLFFACLVCHGELAARKPPAVGLTRYYLVISLGGALGGVLVVFVAPLLFVRFFELHWGILAALASGFVAAWRSGGLDPLRKAARVAITGGGILGLMAISERWLEFEFNRLAQLAFALLWGLLGWTSLDWAAARRKAKRAQGETDLSPNWNLLGWFALALWLGLLIIAFLQPNYFEWLRPFLLLTIGLLVVQVLLAIELRVPALNDWAIGMILAVGLFFAGAFLWSQSRWQRAGLLAEYRNFYGLVSVAAEGDDRMPRGQLITLFSGRIPHGWQYQGAGHRRTATSYYGEISGLGRAFQFHRKRADKPQPMRIGVVGLGAGVIATWSKPGDTVRFFEINPQMETYARKYFTFLADAPGKVSVSIGDGRLLLEQEIASPDFAPYDLLAIDAFSGDSVPRHLLTKECFELYRRVLEADGVLAVHVSNIHVDVQPVVRALAEAIGFNPLLIVGRTKNIDEHVPQAESVWILASRDSAWIAKSELQELASPFASDRRLAWTDDFGSLAQVLRLPRPVWWPGPWPWAN